MLRLAEQAPLEAALVLELALCCDARPADPVTLLPIAGDPLVPSTPRRSRFGTPPPGGSHGVPAELARILRRLGSDHVPDDVVGQLEVDDVLDLVKAPA